MFCSKCGRTVQPGWTECRACGELIGESRFEGVPYTSAQMRILPGQAPVRTREYTRVSYTGGDYADNTNLGDPDVRTSYRPVYDEHSVPEEYRDDLRSALEGSEPMLEEEPVSEEGPAPEGRSVPDVSGTEDDYSDRGPDEEPDLGDFDVSRITARPIVAKKRTGLSPEMQAYVRKLDVNTPVPPAAAEEPPMEEPEYDEEAPEDQPYDDAPRAIDPSRLLKIVAAVVAVAAVAVVAVFVLPGVIANFRSRASAKIEGVTPSLYDQGISVLNTHTEQSYEDSVLALFGSGDYAALTARLDSDRKAIDALLPAEPGVNDELYLSAIGALQEDIGSCITLDAVEISTSGAVDPAASRERWTPVREMIAGFPQVNSAAGLSAIVSGERVLAALPTATPEPVTEEVIRYATLAKGDSGDTVKEMQVRLWELGYLDDDRDGKFGSNTQTAVKLFQQTAGLEVTGVADNATLELLYSNDAPMTDKARITPVPEPTPDPEPTVGAIDPLAEEDNEGGVVVDEPEDEV